MIWQLDLLLLVLALICAVSAISVRDLFSSAVVLGAYSFLVAMALAGMGAVDVAFTEATVGAGASTIFFIAAIYHTTRRTKD
jgi:uncharacterized MnhB-related membrane protein